MARRTLYLPVMIAAAVSVACAVALSTVSEEKAQAAFPGTNGRIAYESGGVIYTINPDGSGKTRVTNTHVSGYPIDYSPDGKSITYTSYEGFNDGNPTGKQKDAESHWVRYLSGWTAWNHVRAAASIAGAATLTIALHVG